MKTKPITLIVSLLFCLSGSVIAEDKVTESSKIKFRKTKNREHRFREIIDFEYLRSQKKYTIEAVDIDDLMLKLKKLKRVKIDMGVLWAIEDIKRSKIKVGIEEIFPNAKQLSFRPLKKYGNLIFYDRILLNEWPFNSGKRARTENGLIHYDNSNRLKTGKFYYGYFPVGHIRATYGVQIKGLRVTKSMYILEYGKVINEAEYNKQSNTGKDEN